MSDADDERTVGILERTVDIVVNRAHRVVTAKVVRFSPRQGSREEESL